MAVIEAAGRIDGETDFHLEQAEHEFAVERLAQGFGPGLEVALGRRRAVKPGDTRAADRAVELEIAFSANTGGFEIGGGVAGQKFLAQGSGEGVR
ncbi:MULTISPECIES: hypothetical protein [Henriciella]|uniref:Uncharacterized protein n=1 Tax=Henriciella pelagia TaxID=1977912 RepID=A0ABQ1JFT3_9PROT|nr:hypothetical protein [Henriciella pelagia]GGB65299.1 hypothetical protein GCM10011503_12660 [Henriciella pelagia]